MLLGARCASAALILLEREIVELICCMTRLTAGFFTVPERERDRFVDSSIDAVRSRRCLMVGVESVGSWHASLPLLSGFLFPFVFYLEFWVERPAHDVKLFTCFQTPDARGRRSLPLRRSVVPTQDQRSPRRFQDHCRAGCTCFAEMLFQPDFVGPRANGIQNLFPDEV